MKQEKESKEKKDVKKNNRPKPQTGPAIYSKLSPAKPTIVFDTYWKFAVERQNIFFNRFFSKKPWTEDPILQEFKFTNTYRAADRVSQYLIKSVIYDSKAENSSPEDIFFRILLFKLFNKIETWELLEGQTGYISYDTYSFTAYDKILTSSMNSGKRIFSAAYIMPSGSKILGHTKKHRNCLAILEMMMRDNVPLKISEMKRMQDAFDLLKSYPMIGDFLSYQFITDINYSELTNFSENEFVVPGPGAKSGIRKCFQESGGLTEEEIIRLMVDIQHKEFERLGLKFQTLWGRDLKLIDCQNIFCEVDKYSRIAHPEINIKNGRTRIKQKIRPNKNKINFFFPPKWGLNDKI